MARHRAPSVCPRPGCPKDQPCPDHTPAPWAGARQRRPDALNGRALQQRNARILQRDHHRCRAQVHHPKCDGTGTEVDHRVPYAEGGTDADENLLAINPLCHGLKSRDEARRGRSRA